MVLSTMRVSNSQLCMCRQKPTLCMSDEFRQAHSPADALAVTDPRKWRAQLVQCKLSCTEEERKLEGTSGSVMKLFSSKPSFRSSIHHEVSLRSICSVVFLDKSLCISLLELEGRAGQPTLYRSTLSCRLAPLPPRSTRDKPAKINDSYRSGRAAVLSTNKGTGQKDALGHCRSPLSKHWAHKADHMVPSHGVCRNANDSDKQRRYGTSSGLLPFRGPAASNSKAGRQKGNADEEAFSLPSKFRQMQQAFSIGLGESGARSQRAGINKTDEEQEDGGSVGPQTVSTLDRTRHHHQLLRNKSEGGTPKPLSLKEALELFRPDFISRSQSRVRRLEQRARRRRALDQSNPDLVQGLREDQGKQKKNCTTPDPLSDNLFKPRERSISGREMQLRSRRIYNKLPEVTKKKEEEKKRAASQTNRQRAEVFKKKLLDQILQR
ncbi:uncharacterized protein LOC133463847 [Cololabis saira]|uniref:uncharacterized protein LOC133463847 n=1 Tax=Cololabis saira TaxID=129043 RepID=UPI002AD55119|nr:uncharacterized protein LOC133463847 [Cololabis saira]